MKIHLEKNIFADGSTELEKGHDKQILFEDLANDINNSMWLWAG